ncbi:hypothetical protein OEZ85_002272 [Tetradesmus obliquus]|uniref:Methyltransferase FkbM domain-containing protein n=1 Tax=Tetradesmus obliquus TaxID=3088 RepID=A0ABY8U6N8_TETOB|nr:hypothetical protein OEZ85_002272 [Tetradesmus obliquus]
MPEQAAAVATWLNTLQQERATPAEKQHQLSYDPKVFSKYVTTSTCDGADSVETVTWIEPLAHGLRHPGALCGATSKAAVMSRDYLLLAHSHEVATAREVSRQRCVNRTCQTIFMDLGATTYDDRDIAGQGWFVRSYERLGLAFDRLLLWEAKPLDPAKVYSKVPPELLHKYQYFNIPAHTDLSSPSHPVRILKQIAQPGDFVVFKLDIDHAESETAILQALLDDPQASALVDEFFFEYHVTFGEMLRYWKSQADPAKSLADAFALFYELRQRGWRAHSWV